MKQLNIIEAMELPVGTLLRFNLSKKFLFKMVEEEGDKYLKVVDDGRKVFLNDVMTKARYWEV
ncbi:MAG: hypothetical protein ACRC1T_05135 [Clostridium chrysemydis]|uniref:hypothetical protein n=1 Tax=Clostridium chrysemydis TaxID=2665504 RepID=UPI003F2BD47E